LPVGGSPKAKREGRRKPSGAHAGKDGVGWAWRLCARRAQCTPGKLGKAARLRRIA
jgi:hypothetical protein